MRILFIICVLLISTNVLSQAHFSYYNCVSHALKDRYEPAPCEITGNGVKTSVWVIQVGAYRGSINPIQNIMMIPFELNRYYLFSFGDDATYNTSLFFSNKESAQKFVLDNSLNELFCQIMVVEFPIADILFFKSPNNVVSSVNQSTQNYIVKPGDTLYSIAKTFKTTIDKIKTINNLVTDVIVPGTTLIIQ